MKKEKYSDIDKEVILDELYKTNKPQSTIAKEFGISVSTIRKWRKTNKNNFLSNDKTIKTFKIMNIIGIILIFCSFIFIRINFLTLSFLLLIFGSLLIIPDSWHFYKNTIYKKSRMEAYWLIKFLSIPIVVLLMIFGLIMYLKKGE